MHFTYTRPKPALDLQQGDILRRTPSLETLMRRVHPYYLKEDYTHFMVLTQTCDLVHRSEGRKAPYIALSAVRPLSAVIDHEMRKYKTNAVLQRADAISERNRERAKAFLKSLLNNNNSEYFYLHEQMPGGLTDRACVYLRLTVSVKDEHYETIKAARILSLKPQFQAKLGWLVGNIYGRVGTDDWVPTQLPEAEWEELINQIMDEHIVVLNDRQVEYVKKNYDQETIAAWSSVEAQTNVRKAPQLKKRDEVIEIVTDELVAADILPPEMAARARAQLSQSPSLKTKLGT